MTMVTALESMTGDVTGEALRTALAATTYTGVTGEIKFDDNGDAMRDTAVIKTMTNGAFQFTGIQKTDGTFTPAE